jgi:xanthine dehydrogenase YagS FAD-binding subunit
LRPFAYRRPPDTGAAVRTVAGVHVPRELPNVHAPIQYIAGGTTMLDLMKLDVMRPRTLVDLNRLGDEEEQHAEMTDAGLRLGALVRMADAAADPRIRAVYPVISDSLRLAASEQIRNMATLGGNVLQRTRCTYFRDTGWAACNKRDPGSGCAAREGVNRQHAVLGASEHCIATYPGDFAQALIALDARVQVHGPRGARTMDFADLHRLPGDTPHLETLLDPGEVITSFFVPAGPWTRRSLYRKVRDRESYCFALASAAVALQLAGNEVIAARIALGGVATVPWRAREAERALEGQLLDEPSAREAAEIAFADAVSYEHNDFKIALGKCTLVEALMRAKAMEV